MIRKTMVDANAWVRTFQSAIDKVVAATMTMHQESVKDAAGKVVDPYQRGYLDGVSEITAAMGAVLQSQADVIKGGDHA